jgi:hypothetical protein
MITGCWCFSAYGQINDASKSIIDKLATFSANHPAEKAYLQFDKPYYAAGDTIYFKAYITKGERHELSGLSGVLHVDMINTNNKIDQSIKLQIDSGVAWGDFALPDSLPTGDYRIRAYTQWMRNDGEAGFFDKVITIGALKTPKTIAGTVNKIVHLGFKPDIQFFPEGGSLVAGVQSKIAFKAIGPDGTGIDVKGTIVDNEGREAASFASAHLGMGYCYLKPAEGKTYSAKIKYPNGIGDTVDLPRPEQSGVILSADNTSFSNVSVRIEANNAWYQENHGKEYTLVIYCQGIATAVSFKLDSTLIKLDILKRKMHSGIVSITLFSPENEPLCERIIFIQNYDQLTLNINAGKDSYTKREKINIKLNAADRKGEAAQGHFSVSVIDESKVPENEKNGDNILSYLLLTSDLKGYIAQPNYYFADTTTAARNNLDILMLTQGYRRFEWKQVLYSVSTPLAYQPEKGITIEGQIKNMFGKPVVKGTVTLFQPKGGLILNSTTDDNGMFHFPGLIFTDTVHFVLSAVNGNGKNSVGITYFNDGKREPAISANRLPAMQIIADTAMALYIDNEKLQQREIANYGKGGGIMLTQVNIRDKKIDDQYKTQSLAGAGNADQVMHANEIEKVEGDLITSLSGRLKGIIFAYKFGTVTPYYLSREMLVVVDGVEHGDFTGLQTSDIETIEVLKYSGENIYGKDGRYGVLIITTKQSRGLNARDVAAVGVLPVSPMGFYKAREFYSPKYDNPSIVSKQRDLRSTIYWQPEIKTDKDGNASFEYYNADGTGTYKMVIEGIDNNGNIGRQVYRYNVE